MHPLLLRTAAAAALATAATAQVAPGLRIFQATGSHETQLVDKNGTIVHSWPGGGNLVAHVAEDGTMWRSVQTGAITVPGATGRIQRLAFDGTVLWDHQVDGPFEFAHHDIEPMPNGNVLVIAWDRYTVADAIAAGRDPASITGTDWLPDAILEIQPTGPTTGTIVWEWHMMDHVVQEFDPLLPNYGSVAANPGLLDINFPPRLTPLADGDWNHFNGLDYDPINDWIVVSARSQDEIYVIDHTTTTAEAAGHTGGLRGKGGDFLWRWGNPQAYGAGTAADKQLAGQHDPRFVAPGYPGAGNITVFNNEHIPNQSGVYELALPLDPSGNFVLDPVTGRYGPTAPLWMYTAPGFVSLFVSGAERLPNGNTLICSGLQNTVFEVDPAGQVVWTFAYPNSVLIFQASYVDRSLWSDTDALAVGGGTVGFDHLTGSAHAGEFYLLLGSVSGAAPGTVVPGGVTLPLNVDYLTGMMATLFNTGIFVDTIGTLDANGGGASSLVVPPSYIPPALASTEMHFAHLVFDGTLLASRASNPVKLTITP